MILIDKGRLYMNTISVEELEKIDSSEITIVDVRPADQYSRGSFPGAVNIPLDEFDERWSLWTGEDGVCSLSYG